MVSGAVVSGTVVQWLVVSGEWLVVQWLVVSGAVVQWLVVSG